MKRKNREDLKAVEYLINEEITAGEVEGTFRSKYKENDLLALRDRVEDAVAKISFLDTALISVLKDERKGAFTSEEVAGLGCIMWEIEDDLNFVVNELGTKQQKGLIVEKKEEI
jgi:hypothetical protein